MASVIVDIIKDVFSGTITLRQGVVLFIIATIVFVLALLLTRKKQLFQLFKTSKRRFRQADKLDRISRESSQVEETVLVALRKLKQRNDRFKSELYRIRKAVLWLEDHRKISHTDSQRMAKSVNDIEKIYDSSVRELEELQEKLSRDIHISQGVLAEADSWAEEDAKTMEAYLIDPEN